MSDWPELVVSVLGIRHRSGHTDLSRRALDDSSIEIDATVIANDMAITTSAIPNGEAVHVRASLTAGHFGIEARGTVAARWLGECRRCLEPVEEPVNASLYVTFLDEASLEIHQPEPDEADVYAFDGESINLGEVVREELMLALPLAPLCSDGCVGVDPNRFVGDEARENDDQAEGETSIDPRWAALSELSFDED